ncbi:hypothetical protein [Enhygromyxa salina]|uniref:hypothetical protein n=1 Tax=Enhygromyxa salina TaxID=215803 RepID=UPI0015E759CE|nr:hypothetical protein [Enhygromyxa salina]
MTRGMFGARTHPPACSAKIGDAARDETQEQAEPVEVSNLYKPQRHTTHDEVRSTIVEIFGAESASIGRSA